MEKTDIPGYFIKIRFKPKVKVDSRVHLLLLLSFLHPYISSTENLLLPTFKINNPTSRR
jgi:hypothetical protein